MVSKAELLEWVEALEDGAMIGVEDGGLALITADESQYLEIGGIPINEEEASRHA